MENIVFSDVDGTLLSSNHRITPDTLSAIRKLAEMNIPFVIVSARSPSGIYPILNRYLLKTPIISYSGALVLDERGNVIFHKGISKEEGRAIISFAENFDAAWNIFSFDDWYVKSRNDPRVRNEENIVEAEAMEGSIDSVEGDMISKIFLICNPSETDEIEMSLKTRFPEYAIVKSDNYLIEIMARGVSKAESVKLMCMRYGIPLSSAIAFGDNYNDEEMLRTVGYGFLMGNAPALLASRISLHTADNDHDGIAKALKTIGVV